MSEEGSQGASKARSCWLSLEWGKWPSSLFGRTDEPEGLRSASREARKYHVIAEVGSVPIAIQSRPQCFRLFSG